MNAKTFDQHLHPALQTNTEPDKAVSKVQTATFRLSRNPLKIEAQLEITPSLLLAISALVSSILLATAVLVRTAKKN